MKPDIWDAHMHLFGCLSRFPVVDGAAYVPTPTGLDAYRAATKSLGIGKAVLVQPSVYGADNRFVLSMLEAHPGFLRGIVTLKEMVSARAALCYRDAGVRGVRINLVQPGGGQEDPVLASLTGLRSAGLHVQIVGRPAHVLPLLERLDQVGATTVVDHMMLLSEADEDGYFLALRRVLDRGNVYVKLSGLYRLHKGEPGAIAAVARMTRRLIQDNGDRLLWGSDWPHPDFTGAVPSPDHLMAVITNECAASIRESVLTQAPLALYG